MKDFGHKVAYSVAYILKYSSHFSWSQQKIEPHPYTKNGGVKILGPTKKQMKPHNFGTGFYTLKKGVGMV